MQSLLVLTPKRRNTDMTAHEMYSLIKRYEEFRREATSGGATNDDIETVATIGILADIMYNMHKEEKTALLAEIAKLQFAVKTLSNAVENLSCSLPPTY